jgi:predicted secreted protein
VRVYRHLLLLALTSSATFTSSATEMVQSKQHFDDKFRQLEESLPTPNDYRNAAGKLGIDYWQQQVDYKINVTLDEPKRRIQGEQVITYHINVERNKHVTSARLHIADAWQYIEVAPASK